MKAHTLPIMLTFLAPFASHADLVGHWTLDDGAGTTAVDSTANGRDGTLRAGTAWTTADLPQVPGGTTAAASFDGIDDDILITGYKGVTGTGDRTISAWIKTAANDVVQDRSIVSWGTNLAGQKWNFRIQSGNGTQGAIRVEVNGGYLVGNAVVTDGEWHHVAMTWANDGSPNVEDVKLYVDGLLDADLSDLGKQPSQSLSQSINTASANDVRIGRDFSSRFWEGSMDDVRIYDEALDAAGIATLFEGAQVISSFSASEEVVASGSPVTLSWVADPGNDTLTIDNEVGDVSGLSMIMVNPTTTTTYTLTGTRDGLTRQQEVTVLVDSVPVIQSYENSGQISLLAGQSTELVFESFGETSLSINGNDVSGVNRLQVSPTETTTYILTATNQFGSSTSEIVVTVLGDADPDLSWDASGLTDGILDRWDPVINVTPNNQITFLRNTGGEVQSGVSNFSGVGSWVSNPGYNFSSDLGASWQNALEDLVTKQDVTWEMVVRPGDFTGTHTLFNTGGSVAGTAVVLTDSTLDFRIQTTDADAERVIISTDLANIGGATDFYHVVAIAEVGAAEFGAATLYVNGALVAGRTESTAVMNDWAGTDLAELGKGGNIPTSNVFPFEAFTGDIALFNYYQNRILDASLVMEKYEAISGSGNEFEITDVQFDSGADEIRVTFPSVLGRAYRLETSVDLENWNEVNDSILGAETETIFPFMESNLLDAGSPRRFFRLSRGVQ